LRASLWRMSSTVARCNRDRFIWRCSSNVLTVELLSVDTLLRRRRALPRHHPYEPVLARCVVQCVQRRRHLQCTELGRQRGAAIHKSHCILADKMLNVNQRLEQRNQSKGVKFVERAGHQPIAVSTVNSESDSELSIPTDSMTTNHNSSFRATVRRVAAEWNRTDALFI